MLSRSSIFSFDTLSIRLRFSPAVAVAAVLVVAVRVLIGMTGDTMLRFPGPTRGDNMLVIERDLIEPLTVPPRVVILGSSRIRYGLLEDVFADEASLDRKEVVNLALLAGTTYDATLLMRRNPQVLEGAQLVITDVGRWMFNKNQPELLLPMFYRYANLHDRLLLDSADQRVQAVADLLFLHYRERRSLGNWLQGVIDLTRDYYELDSSAERVLWTKEATEIRKTQRKFHPRQAAIRHMADYEQSHRMHVVVDEFAEMCRQRGAKVVFVHTPTTDAYRTCFSEIPGAPQAEEEYFRWLKSFGREHNVIVFNTPDSAGIRNDQFVDYGHLNREGATQLTKAVVKEMFQRSLLPPPPVQR